MGKETTFYNEHDTWTLDRVEATADWFDHFNPFTQITQEEVDGAESRNKVGQGRIPVPNTGEEKA
jgi:hypothetical protein